MTTQKELTEEIFSFIMQKKEELKAELDDFTAPFIATMAEPESDDDFKYAKEQFDKAMSNESDCDKLLCDIEDLLNEN